MSNETVAKAEELHRKGQVIDSYIFLKEQQSKNPEIEKNPEVLWRLARGEFEYSETESDATSKKEHIMKGVEYAKKGVETGGDSADNHKWYGILLGSSGDYIGAKEKLENAFKIHEEAIKADSIKPNDPATLHMLGRWCYEISNIGMIQRTLAKTFVADPPHSSYQEALGYFMKAQNADPNSVVNGMFIGNTYEKLHDQNQAKEWFEKVAHMKPHDALDKKTVQEAMKKIGAN